MSGVQAALKRANEEPLAKKAHCGEKRAIAAVEHTLSQDRGQKLLKRYDSNQSGSLCISELKSLLNDLNHGKNVNDDEVEFILSATDKTADAQIDRKEMPFLMIIWNTYTRSIPEIDLLMEEYDEDRSGRLEREEVRKLLERLNEGKAVKDKEVDFVISEAGMLGNGSITKPEIKRAIRAWYVHVETNPAELPGAAAESQPGRSSACCSLQ